MEQRIIVCWIVKNWSKVLVGKKAKWQPPYPDVWHTLGWWIENLELWTKLLSEKDYDNEYFHKELKRELMEEANILVNNIKNICPQYKSQPREWVTKNKHWIDTHYIFLEYVCDYNKWETKPWDDIAELQWIEKDNIRNISLTPPSIEMYKELGLL